MSVSLAITMQGIRPVQNGSKESAWSTVMEGNTAQIRPSTLQQKIFRGRRR